MVNTHMISLATWDFDSLATIIDQASHYKHVIARRLPDKMRGQNWVLLFEKPSTRTRLSFEIGMQKLGVNAIFSDFQSSSIAARETPADLARNLACWADGVVVRANSHQTLCALAAHSDIPVVNALCDRYHPCQAVADFQTLSENGLCNNSTHLVYVGDGNNVCHSLMHMARLFAVNLTVLTPPGFEPKQDVVEFCQGLPSAATLTVTSDLDQVAPADVVYTDGWISMGSTYNKTTIEQAFAPYQVDDDLMRKLKAKFFMHCQPMTRGMEVTSSIADGEASIIFQQATNRMWSQMAILNFLSKENG